MEVLTCCLQMLWVGAQIVCGPGRKMHCQMVGRSQGAGLSSLPEVCHQQPAHRTGGAGHHSEAQSSGGHS